MTIKHVHERPVIATAEMPHTATESKDGKGRKTIGRTTSGAGEATIEASDLSLLIE